MWGERDIVVEVMDGVEGREEGSVWRWRRGDDGGNGIFLNMRGEMV